MEQLISLSIQINFSWLIRNLFLLRPSGFKTAIILNITYLTFLQLFSPITSKIMFVASLPVLAFNRYVPYNKLTTKWLSEAYRYLL